MDILVTGFGPFPHVRVNPTAILARDVARQLGRSGLIAKALVLETSYGGGLPALKRFLDETSPKAVLMLGLAARARYVRVELFGRGHASRLHPDATGATPAGGSASPFVLPLRTTAGAEAALAGLRQAGIRARLSPSAGRYLCDASYALALRTAGGAGIPVLFIHVPWLRPAPGCRPLPRVAEFRPRQPSLAAALVRIGRDLARQGRAKTAQGIRHAA